MKNNLIFNLCNFKMYDDVKLKKKKDLIFFFYFLENLIEIDMKMYNVISK